MRVLVLFLLVFGTGTLAGSFLGPLFNGATVLGIVCIFFAFAIQRWIAHNRKAQR